jgi:hypothetical protein
VLSLSDSTGKPSISETCVVGMQLNITQEKPRGDGTETASSKYLLSLNFWAIFQVVIAGE